jgi:protease II
MPYIIDNITANTIDVKDTLLINGEEITSGLQTVSVDGVTIVGNGTTISPLTAVTSTTYKVYTALLTQTGTDAPVATVLENTIGDIVWTRDDVGVYFATLPNAFTENKTWFNIISNSNSVSTNETVAIYWNSVNDIHVQTGIGTVSTDGRLYLNSIEIRVYN